MSLWVFSEEIERLKWKIYCIQNVIHHIGSTKRAERGPHNIWHSTAHTETAGTGLICCTARIFPLQSLPGAPNNKLHWALTLILWDSQSTAAPITVSSDGQQGRGHRFDFYTDSVIVSVIQFKSQHLVVLYSWKISL